MRATHALPATLALATALTTAATLMAGAPANAAGETEPVRERGIVVECTGTIAGRPVFASLYENSAYTNVIHVLIGDDDRQVGNSREVADGFRDGRQVHGVVRVGGRRALVEGTARRVGEPIPVHEEYDDAGQLVTADGHHRRLATRLDLTWGRRTTPLECGTAFSYNLSVTREPVAG